MACTLRLAAVLTLLAVSCSVARAAVPYTTQANYLVRSFNATSKVFTAGDPAKKLIHVHIDRSILSGGVNDKGIVSGYAAVAVYQPPYISFKFNAPKFRTNYAHSFTKLKIGNRAYVYGLNNAGLVVGGGSASLGIGAFYYKGSKAYKINKPQAGAKAAIAYGINNNGDIAGSFYDKYNNTLGFLWLGKKGLPHFATKKIIKPKKTALVVYARAVNDRRIVTGFFSATDQPMGHTAGFTYNAVNGAYRVHKDLVPPAGWPALVYTQFLGISNNLLVVGYYEDATGAEHGFVYDARPSKRKYLVIFDHPEAAIRIPRQSGPGGTMTQLTGISLDGKYITGIFMDTYGVLKGFVLKKKDGKFFKVV